MEQKLGPSRLDEILQPYLLAGVLLATVSIAGLALTYDEPRAEKTIQIVFAVLLFPTLLAVMPYMGSIAAQGIGSVSFPLIGVRAAAAGCAGFAVLIGLALSRPLGLEALLGLVVAIGLIAIQVRANSRRTSPSSGS
jgi:hypothetical protein